MGFRVRLKVQSQRKGHDPFHLLPVSNQKGNISIPLHLFSCFNLISDLYCLPVVLLYQPVNWCSALSPYLHTCPQTHPFYLVPSYQLNFNKTLVSHCTLFQLHSHALYHSINGFFFFLNLLLMVSYTCGF